MPAFAADMHGVLLLIHFCVSGEGFNVILIVSAFTEEISCLLHESRGCLFRFLLLLGETKLGSDSGGGDCGDGGEGRGR